MPKLADGYDLVAIAEWLEARNTARADAAELKLKKLEAETRHKEAQAEKMELATGRERGELMLRADAERCLRELVLRVRDRISQLPGSLSRLLPKPKRPEAERRARDHINGVLTEMSTWKFENTDVDDSGDNDA